MKTVHWVTAFIVFCCLVVLFGCERQRPIEPASATVKIMAGSGHGSGVSIGEGIIITAAHVVGDETAVKLKSEAGDIQDGEVLWTNTKYDIALVRASNPRRFGASSLTCETAATNQSVRIEGNPGNVEFVTTWGRIAGEPRALGPWASVYVLDQTIVPGQSGGPLYNEDGEVIGIATGVMVVPIGFSGALVGIGYAVPSTVVCGLMGQA